MQGPAATETSAAPAEFAQTVERHEREACREGDIEHNGAQVVDINGSPDEEHREEGADDRGDCQDCSLGVARLLGGSHSLSPFVGIARHCYKRSNTPTKFGGF
jgi:hypothetical protein